MTAAVKPYTMRAPESATSSTVRSCPGSKRTAVPAAMFRRKPRAAARSKESAPLVVRADLDRPVARVGDRELDRLAPLVELEVAGAGKDFPGDHGIG